MACLEGGPVGAGSLAAGGGAPSRVGWRPSRPCRERGRCAQAATWAWAAVLAHAGAPFPSLDLSRRIWSDDPASCAQAIKGGDFGEAANPNFFSILLPSRHSHPAARKHRRLDDGEPLFSLLCLLFSFYQLRRTSAAKELWFLADRALLLPLCFFFLCRARPAARRLLADRDVVILTERFPGWPSDLSVLLFLKKMSMADRTCCSNYVFSFFPCLCFCAFSSIWPLVHWSTCSSFVTPLAIQPYASRSLSFFFCITWTQPKNTVVLMAVSGYTYTHIQPHVFDPSLLCECMYEMCYNLWDRVRRSKTWM
jgi:hypothetical protein